MELNARKRIDWVTKDDGNLMNGEEGKERKQAFWH
jgi:hypothetical protein